MSEGIYALIVAVLFGLFILILVYLESRSTPDETKSSAKQKESNDTSSHYNRVTDLLKESERNIEKTLLLLDNYKQHLEERTDSLRKSKTNKKEK